MSGFQHNLFHGLASRYLSRCHFLGRQSSLAAQSKTFEAYKQRELTDNKDAHDLAIRFWDAGALGALEIPRVIKEWRAPQHPEFAQGSKTAWRLFNAVTETIKGDLWRLPARTRRIHAILDAECGEQTMENGSVAEPAEKVEVTA